jgi:hypothetical protein
MFSNFFVCSLVKKIINPFNSTWVKRRLKASVLVHLVECYLFSNARNSKCKRQSTDFIKFQSIDILFMVFIYFYGIWLIPFVEVRFGKCRLLDFVLKIVLFFFVWMCNKTNWHKLCRFSQRCIFTSFRFNILLKILIGFSKNTSCYRTIRRFEILMV